MSVEGVSVGLTDEQLASAAVVVIRISEDAAGDPEAMMDLAGELHDRCDALGSLRPMVVVAPVDWPIEFETMVDSSDDAAVLIARLQQRFEL